jgi:hypothetical protein
MNESTLFIHVGPGKTATTFLQNVVLAKTRSVESLVKPIVELGGEKLRFGDLFNFPPEVWNDSEGGAFAHLIRHREGHGSLIISDEHVFGGLASPQPWIPDPARKIGPIVRLYRQTNGQTDTYSMAAHLRRLSAVATNWGFAETKVLAVTRQQDTRLASGYAQVSDRVRGADQEGFEAWVRHLTQNPVGYYMGGGLKLDYLAWYNEIESAVGANSVRMLPFELLGENEVDFVRRYLTMLGAEESDVERVVDDLKKSASRKRNVSSRTGSEWLLREPVRTGPRLRPARLCSALGLPGRLPLRWPDFSRENSIFLTSDLSREILGTYEQSNQQLDEVLPGLELGKHGYY